MFNQSVGYISAMTNIAMSNEIAVLIEVGFFYLIAVMAYPDLCPYSLQKCESPHNRYFTNALYTVQVKIITMKKVHKSFDWRIDNANF
ncbi:hypothetical protein VHA01S_013_00050 [Vibrio halioticoli NBRC 102217]|uniref:Uncharacterized protein n=1 Tax=Vibrio halioticoli NBRC 102217 TaxID=1219072 RepID=V5FC45_9VIBR|nr:hypothetical protein VHA01S_013_00050 [Vibrio halioticoli NBRC 102217]